MTTPITSEQSFSKFEQAKQGDLEELEYLETMAQSAAMDLEQVLKEAEEFHQKLVNARVRYTLYVNRRDALKEALQGMGITK